MEPRPVHKIGSLTSLRFFAAAAIVVHHCRGLFSIPPTLLANHVLDQAVGFFFVLSGFILTYVYPTLEAGAWKRFLLGRFARIWPGHVAAMLLLFALMPLSIFHPSGHVSPLTLAGNVLMVQTWLPIDGQFFSYNAPSWSISTEFGFYLLFPLLIHRWEQTWHLKVVAVLLVCAGMITIATVALPFTAYPLIRPNDLIYSHPLGRLFEFTVGMLGALVWRRWEPRVRSAPMVGTLWEIGALALVVFTISESNNWWYAVRTSGRFGPAIGLWLGHGVFSCLPFAVFIVVMAFERGWISRALGAAPLVLLGEISYSIYLVHYILLRAAAEHAPSFARIPAGIALTLYILTVLLSAYLIWVCIERPARRALMVLASRQAPRREPAPSGVIGRSPVLQGVAIGVCMFVVWLLVDWRFGIGLDDISMLDGQRIAAAGSPASRNVKFGNGLELVGTRCDTTGGWLTIDLVWRSLASQRLDHRVGVHLTDAAGAIRAQADYNQSIGARFVDAETTWRDRIVLPASLLDGATGLALSVYDRGSTLTVDRGPRDWDNHRLVLNLAGMGGF